MKIKQEKVFPENVVAAEICPTMALLAVATPSYMTVIRAKTMATLFSLYACPKDSVSGDNKSSNGNPLASLPPPETTFAEYFDDLLANIGALVEQYVPSSQKTDGNFAKPSPVPIYENLVASEQRVISGIQWSPCGRLIAVSFSTPYLHAVLQENQRSKGKDLSVTLEPFAVAVRIVHVESNQVLREIVGLNPLFMSLLIELRFDRNRTDSRGQPKAKAHVTSSRIGLLIERLVSDLHMSTSTPITVLQNIFSSPSWHSLPTELTHDLRHLKNVHNHHDRQQEEGAYDPSVHISPFFLPSASIGLAGFGWSVLPICNTFSAIGVSECGHLRPCFESAAQSSLAATSAALKKYITTKAKKDSNAPTNSSESTFSAHKEAAQLSSNYLAYSIHHTLTRDLNTCSEATDSESPQNAVPEPLREMESFTCISHPQSLISIIDTSGGTTTESSDQIGCAGREDPFSVDTSKPLTTLFSMEALRKSWADGLCSVLLVWGVEHSPDDNIQNARVGKHDEFSTSLSSLSVLAGGCFELLSTTSAYSLREEVHERPNNNDDESFSGARRMHNPFIKPIRREPLKLSMGAMHYEVMASPFNGGARYVNDTNINNEKEMPFYSSSSSCFSIKLTATTENGHPLRSSKGVYETLLTPSELENSVVTAFSEELCHVGLSALTASLSFQWDGCRKVALESMRILQTGSLSVVDRIITPSAATVPLCEFIKINDLQSRSSFENTRKPELRTENPSTTNENKAVKKDERTAAVAVAAENLKVAIPGAYHYDTTVLSLVSNLLVAFAARPRYTDIASYFGVGTHLLSKNEGTDIEATSAVTCNVPEDRNRSLTPVDFNELQEASAFVDKGFGALMVALNQIVLPSLSWASAYASRVQELPYALTISRWREDVFTVKKMETPLSSSISKLIEHTECALQHAADQRDELLLLLQYIFQQKLKITNQQRTALVPLLPPSPSLNPDKSEHSSGNKEETLHFNPQEKLIASMIPSEAPKITDLLNPIVSALLPQDCLVIENILSALSQSGAFSPHIFLSQHSFFSCPALSSATSGEGKILKPLIDVISSGELLWNASCCHLMVVSPKPLIRLFENYFGNDVDDNVDCGPRTDDFVSEPVSLVFVLTEVSPGRGTQQCPPRSRIFDIVVDLPPMLQYNAVGQRKLSKKASSIIGSDNVLIPYDESSFNLLQRDVKMMTMTDSDNESSQLTSFLARKIGIVSTPSCADNAEAITLVHERLSDPREATLNSAVEKHVELAELLSMGGIEVQRIVSTQTHIAILFSSKSATSWIHGYVHRQFEREADIRSQISKKKTDSLRIPPVARGNPSISNAVPFAGVILVDRQTYAPDDGLVLNNEEVSVVCLPTDFPRPASTAKLSINAERGLLAVSNVSRMVVYDLFEDDEEEDSEEDDSMRQ